MTGFQKAIFLSAAILGVLSASLQAQSPSKSQDQPLEQALYFYELGYLEQARELLLHAKTLEVQPAILERIDYFLTRINSTEDSLNTLIFIEDFVNAYPESELSRDLLLEAAQRFKASARNRGAIFYYDRLLKMEPDSAKRAQLYYWKAESFVAQGDTSNALQVFSELANIYRDSEWAPKALYSNGRLYLAQNLFDEATREFEILKERYPNNPTTRRVGTALGESYYQQKKYDAAATSLKQAIPYLDDEQRLKATYLIAESYNVLELYREASTYYLQYINMGKGKDVRIAHYGLGWVYHKQQIYHWAAESFAKAAKGDDELSQKALYYKAINEKLGSRYDLALKTFREFGDRFKTGIWAQRAYYEWAISTFEYGDYVTTIDLCLELLKNNQNMENPGEILSLLGEAYFANREYTRAIQVFEEAEKSVNIPDSTKVKVRFQKAWILYENNAYKQAQPLFEQLFREYPDTELGSEALFWSADCYYTLEDYGPAGALFDRFVRNYDQHRFLGAAYYSLGWSKFKMREYAAAADAFQVFKTQYEPPPIALFPYDTDTQLRLGDAYYAMGKYESALEQYEQAIGAEPGGDYALFQIANSYYRLEMSYDAVTTFRRMLRIYPFSRLREQAQYNIAYIYFLIGNYDQAVKEFATVIRKYPGTEWAARAQYNIGDAFYNAGQFQQAVQAYQQVLDKFPRSEYIIEAVNGIQYAQIAQGQADSSSAVLEDFLDRYPRSTTADRLRFRQAETLLQSGDYAGAVASFQQYIRVTNIERMIPEAYFNLADAFTQMGQLQNAIKAYDQIILNFKSSPKRESAFSNKAQLLLEQNNLEAAKQTFIELKNQNGKLLMESLVGLGRIEFEQSSYDTARTHFERALRLSPRNDDALLGLAKIDFVEGKLEETVEVFRNVAERNSAAVGAEAQYYLGRVYQRKAEYEKAIEAFLNVRVLFEVYDDWVANALVGAAECYIISGQRGNAEALLSEVIENYSYTDAAKRAEQLTTIKR